MLSPHGGDAGAESGCPGDRVTPGLAAIQSLEHSPHLGGPEPCSASRSVTRITGTRRPFHALVSPGWTPHGWVRRVACVWLGVARPILGLGRDLSQRGGPWATASSCFVPRADPSFESSGSPSQLHPGPLSVQEPGTGELSPSLPHHVCEGQYPSWPVRAQLLPVLVDSRARATAGVGWGQTSTFSPGAVPASYGLCPPRGHWGQDI